MKKKLIVVLAVVAIILTCPVWIIKAYFEISDMVYKSIKDGVKGVSE